jgi:hypothetical protein
MSNASLDADEPQGRGTYPRPRIEREADEAGVVGISPHTWKTQDVAYPFEGSRFAAHLEGISDVPCFPSPWTYPHDFGSGSLGLDAGEGISSNHQTKR